VTVAPGAGVTGVAAARAPAAEIATPARAVRTMLRRRATVDLSAGPVTASTTSGAQRSRRSSGRTMNRPCRGLRTPFTFRLGQSRGTAARGSRGVRLGGDHRAVSRVVSRFGGRLVSWRSVGRKVTKGAHFPTNRLATSRPISRSGSGRRARGPRPVQVQRSGRRSTSAGALR
jgi:hypothetical protein